RLSTITGCPSALAIVGVIRRTEKSMMPPASAATKRIGLFGKSCPAPNAGTTAFAVAKASAAIRYAGRITTVAPHLELQKTQLRPPHPSCLLEEQGTGD